MEESKNQEVEIQIKDLFVVFSRIWWILLIIGIVVCGGIFTTLKLTRINQYTATAYVYINRPSGTLQAQQVSISNALVYDYLKLVTMESTLKDVRETVCTQMEAAGEDASALRKLPITKFKKMIGVKNNADDRWVELSVTTEDEVSSVVLADALARISVNTFNNTLLGGETYSKYSEPLNATEVNPDKPGSYAPITNPISKGKILLVGFAVCLIVYLVFFFLYVMDDKINKAEDVEKYLGLNLLGEIPYRHANRKGGEYYAAKTAPKGDRA